MSNYQRGESGFSSGFGWNQGSTSPQPHVDVPEGTYEEEFGRKGFFGRASHLYHRHPPTGWLRIEGALKPRAYYASKLEGLRHGHSEVFLQNSDVFLGMSKLDGPMEIFVRNADEDELHFIHEGSGVLESDFGDLNYQKGDYLMIPRGTSHRFVAEGKTVKLVIQSNSEFELPERGMLGRHAQFDPMIMGIPKLPENPRTTGKNASGEFELHVKREGEWTKIFYPFHPMDIAGWKGDLAVWSINVKDIRPIVSPRYHLAPSVHTTFVARNFVVCTFLPRPLETEAGAMKVPFYHRNIDFDEVIFYHEGNFFSREGIEAGAVTWHPQGVHHGPHPNAAKNAADKDYTHEIAVMVDTRNPLKATDLALHVEYSEYHMSWREDQKR